MEEVSGTATCMDEKYTFLSPAGKGTYGTTWIAVDKVTAKKVAIKHIEKTTTSRSTFKKELKYSKHISKHPNIITTYNTAYETKTSFILLQEFAPGGDLFDAIELKGGIHESRARIYLEQIAKAIDYMHERKLVHCDIKPENVVLGDMDGTYVQLIDFGKTLRCGTHVSKVSGSIPYMPPEICTASDKTGYLVSASYDVWSVGITLFIMLTGSFSWEQATITDPNFHKFWQWQTGAVQDVPHFWQKFSFDLRNMFSKLLDVNPCKRCKITEVYSYLDKPWCNCATIPVNSGDELNITAKQKNILCSCK